VVARWDWSRGFNTVISVAGQWVSGGNGTVGSSAAIQTLGGTVRSTAKVPFLVSSDILL